MSWVAEKVDMSPKVAFRRGLIYMKLMQTMCVVLNEDNEESSRQTV